MPSSLVTSFSTSLYNLNGKYAAVMDSTLAIALGLALRILFDVVGQNDVRIDGSLVGLWEGLVLFHFLEKWPKSYDAYVGFGFRLFVDLLVTADIARLIVIVLWTSVGMVLSDIGPIVWQNTGLKRIYRNLRHDLLLIDIPGLRKNSNTRVRFYSPSRGSSPSPDDTSTPSVPLPSRPLPGSFPGDAETATEPSVRDDDASSAAGDEEEDDMRPVISPPTHTITSTSNDTFSTVSSTSEDRPSEDRTPTPLSHDLPPVIHDEDDLDLYVEVPPPTANMRTIPSEYFHSNPLPPAPPSPTSDFSRARYAPLPPSPPDSHVLPELEASADPEGDDTITLASLRRPGDRRSIAETEFAQESVISGADDPDHVLDRAKALRNAAKDEDTEWARVKSELEEAKKQRNWKDAFVLKREMKGHSDNVTKLNEKAARRFRHAQNMDSASQTIVVCHLSSGEAIEYIEKKLEELWKENPDAQLRVDVGSTEQIAPTDCANLRHAIQVHFNDELHIPIEKDPDNPRILIIHALERPR